MGEDLTINQLRELVLDEMLENSKEIDQLMEGDIFPDQVLLIGERQYKLNVILDFIDSFLKIKKIK